MTTPAPPDDPQSATGPAGADPWAPPGGSDQAPDQAKAPAPTPSPADVQAPAPEIPAQPEAPAPDAPAAPAAFPTAPAAGVPGVPGPGVPYWQAYPMPAPLPPPRNGLGTSAMVLGIVATAMSLAVILFWLSWLPAVLAVVFGVIGLRYARRGVATNRGMALAGVILGVVALLVSAGSGVFVVKHVQTVAAHRKAEDDAERARVEAEVRAAEEREAKRKELEAQARERLEAERKRLEAEREKRAADERARRLTFGESYTYENGLKVTMAKPEPYAPSGYGSEIPKNAVVVQVRITMVNTGSQNISLYGSGLPTVRDSQGNLIFTVIDGSGRMKLPADTLAPGQQAVSLTAYALPGASADPFTVSFYHGSGQQQRKDVQWTGSPR
ncbi:hypothetical protein [Kitasatospora sp. NPDC093806]|uniref:DUF4190 domain-containing protein n=1 Tax=Kitasatospora sp. NPDC093806 TaxID=3155075 RepID=UPI00343C0A53